MREQESHTGGCLCGAVRYRVTGPSVWTAVCYCESCTRAAGAPALAWAGFEKSRFEMLEGGLATHESSPGVLRGFCARCGTTLTYQKNPAVLNGAQDDVYVTTRSLDDPGAYPPDEHVYYGERAPWLHVVDDLPHHEGVSREHAHRQRATMTVRK